MRNAVKFCTLALSLGTLLVGGCASDDGVAQLNVHGAQSDDQYVDTFDRALFTQTRDGQVDLLLLSGGDSFQQNQPLISSDTRAINPGVRQVVHLRVLWEPTRTIHLDSPSASNAFVDWHVIAGPNDRVTYNGSCWAMVKIDGNEASIDLRNASVSVSQVLGDAKDPLKRANLSGKFTATRSDAVVRSYLSELASLDHTTATAQVTPQ
ncbi:MAG: hypothetical protein ACTHM6_03445 [Tepidisphaeraceae bacterium]